MLLLNLHGGSIDLLAPWRDTGSAHTCPPPTRLSNAGVNEFLMIFNAVTINGSTRLREPHSTLWEYSKLGVEPECVT